MTATPSTVVDTVKSSTATTPEPMGRGNGRRPHKWPLGRAIAFVVAMVAAGAAAWNAWLNRLAIRVHVLRDLVKEYGDSRMRQSRRVAAVAILSERTKESTLFQFTADVREVEDVLDFFETIALFVRRHVIDARLVWHTFHRDIAGWWTAAQPLIEHERKQHVQVWGDLDSLVRRLDRIESRYGHYSVDVNELIGELSS